MKKLLIMMSLILVTSCSTDTHYRKYQKVYEYAKENLDYESRPGYAGKVCTIYTKNKYPDSVTVILQEYDYTTWSYFDDVVMEIPSNTKIKTYINPKLNYSIIIQIGENRYRVWEQPFPPANKVYLDEWIEMGIKKHNT